MKDKLPKGWEWKRLGDIAIVSSGNSALQDSSYYFDGTFDFVRTSDVGRIRFGKIFSAKDKLNKTGFKKMQLFKKGTILFPKSGASVLLNHRVILEKDACVSSHLATIKSINNICEDYYLLYFLATISAKDLIAEMSYPSLRTSVIQKILVPLPSLFEQKQIVSVLDRTFEKLDQAIALVKENIQKLKQLNESVLDEVFNVLLSRKNLVKLGTLGNIKAGGTPLRSKKGYWGGSINWFTSGELNDKYVYNSKEFITNTGYENSNARLFPKGTLLVGMYDTAAFKMSILKEEATCNQAIVGIKPDKSFISEYLYYQLTYLRPFVLNLRQGVRQQNLNASKIKDIDIYLPLVTEQQRIVAYLDQTTTKNNQLIQHYQNKLEALKRLKNSVLDSAFKGALRREKVAKKVNVVFYQMQLIGLSVEANKSDNIVQGEMAIAKDIYLLDRLYGVPTQMNFVNHSWGPFAPEIKKGITNKQYFRKKNFPNSKATYVTVLNDGDLFKTVYPELRNQVFNGISNLNQQLFSKISPYKRAETKELLATVLKCMEDTHSVELSVIRKAMHEWKIEQGQFKTKAEKFSEKDTNLMVKFVVKENWHLKVLN